MLFFTPENYDEAFAKVIVEGGNMVVMVHKDAAAITSHSRALHRDGDYIYQLPPDAQENEEAA